MSSWLLLSKDHRRRVHARVCFGLFQVQVEKPLVGVDLGVNHMRFKSSLRDLITLLTDADLTDGLGRDADTFTDGKRCLSPRTQAEVTA